MVRISNTIDTFEVSVGAFEGIFKRQGYKIIGTKDSQIISSDEVEGTKQNDSEDEEFLNDIIEKPITKWNKTEIKKYAYLMDIDISEANNSDEAREIIKQSLNIEE